MRHILNIFVVWLYIKEWIEIVLRLLFKLVTRVEVLTDKVIVFVGGDPVIIVAWWRCARSRTCALPVLGRGVLVLNVRVDIERAFDRPQLAILNTFEWIWLWLYVPVFICNLSDGVSF